ncbi:MAG: hypothetical protein ACI4R8_03525 [Candidatus Caccovivens sp.]
MSKKAIIFSIIAAVTVAVSTVVPVAVVYGGHKHNVSTEWQYDETSHWHVCEGSDCQERFNIGEHVFADTTDKDVPATTESEGKDYKICVVCHYETYDVIPKLSAVETISLSEFDQKVQEAAVKYIEDNTYETYADKCISYVSTMKITGTQTAEYYESEEASNDEANLKKGTLTTTQDSTMTLKITRVGQGDDTMFKIEKNENILAQVPEVNSSTKVLTIMNLKAINNETYYLGRKLVDEDTQSYEYYVMNERVVKAYTYDATLGDYTLINDNTTKTYQAIAEETPGVVPANYISWIKDLSTKIDDNVMTNFFDVTDISGGPGSSTSSGFLSTIKSMEDDLGISVNTAVSAQKENGVYTCNLKGTSSFVTTDSSNNKQPGNIDLSMARSYNNNELGKVNFFVSMNIPSSLIGEDAVERMNVENILEIEYLDQIESFELPETTGYESGTISIDNLFTSSNF